MPWLSVTPVTVPAWADAPTTMVSPVPQDWVTWITWVVLPAPSSAWPRNVTPDGGADSSQLPMPAFHPTEVLIVAPNAGVLTALVTWSENVAHCCPVACCGVCAVNPPVTEPGAPPPLPLDSPAMTHSVAWDSGAAAVTEGLVLLALLSAMVARSAARMPEHPRTTAAWPAVVLNVMVIVSVEATSWAAVMQS